MAEQYYGTPPQAYGQAQFTHADSIRPETDEPTGPRPASKIVNYAGAFVSLALIVGVAVWGYKLMVRDVTGVPVVAAIDGPMRVAPDDPGGAQADHQGLAVNEVAAAGEASAPEDRLVLAPQPVELETNDTPVLAEDTTAAPVDSDAEARVQTSINSEAVETPAEPLTAEEILALADRIAANVDPLAPLEAAPEQVETVNAVAAVAAVSPDVPGVTRSLRPNTRPASLNTLAAVAAAPVTQSVSQTAEVDVAAIAAGTRLVQLGAYESAEFARSEWGKITGRFGEYMEGKQRVVQKASIGGKTFYRLRALGFDNLGDARRFCSALVAENAACIPVVAR